MDERAEEIVQWIAQPHDAGFKGMFSDPPVMGVVLHQEMRHLASAVELEELEIVPASFVDSELRQRHADLVFRAPLRPASPDGYVYVVVEHLSSARRSIYNRMLAYFLQVHRAHAQRVSSQRGVAEKPRATVVGFVVYTGERRWRLADGSASMPFSNITISDVHSMERESVRNESLAEVAAALAISLVAHVRSPDLLRVIEENAERYRLLVADAHYRLHHLPLHLKYVQAVTEAPMAEAALNKFEEIVPETRDVRRTILGKCWHEAMAEGRVEGRQEGRNEGVRAALRTLIASRGLELDTQDVERIDSCDDVAQLTLWIERAATAVSVAQVFS